MSSAGMIDRVGRAIAEEDGADFDSYPLMYRALARAAIEAMLEPTDAMCSFAEDNFDRNGDNIAVCWRAFISAALTTTHNPEEM